MTARDYAVQTIDIAENDVFAALCGPLDSHLTLLEQTLDLSISRSGNRLLLQGDSESVDHGEEILRHLMERHHHKGGVDEEDVKGALRFAGYEITSLPRQSIPGVVTSTDGLRTPRKQIMPRSPAQAEMINHLRSKSLVFGMGPAGTGKTYLAVAAAVAALNEGKVERIILSRPAVEAGERIGFLPGDMKEKVDPYMQPLYDALGDCLPSKQLTRMYDDKTIEIAPLAFMRGRTLARAFVVLDEAQNATIPQMKMFLTRLGQDSVMAITGDESQVDLPGSQPSGLSDAVDRLQNLDAIGVTKFTDADVVRHPLVAQIIRAYQS